jgi:hypothetical protein
MAGSVAASDESILSALPGDVRWPHGAEASAPHDARISGRDSVLRRQFPKKPDETQCDTATAPSSKRGEGPVAGAPKGMTIKSPDVKTTKRARRGGRALDWA